MDGDCVNGTDDRATAASDTGAGMDGIFYVRSAGHDNGFPDKEPVYFFPEKPFSRAFS